MLIFVNKVKLELTYILNDVTSSGLLMTKSKPVYESSSAQVFYSVVRTVVPLSTRGVSWTS